MLMLIDNLSDWPCEEVTPEKKTEMGVRIRLERSWFHEASRIRPKTTPTTCRVDQPDYELVRLAFESIEAKLHDIAREYRFRQLAGTWKTETRFMSNVTAKALHPAYQKIIGMGEPAVPLILRDLQENGPRDWFWALYMITEANPVNESILGNMAAMTEAWLRWGRKKGYLKN